MKHQIIEALMKPQHEMHKKEVAPLIPFADDLLKPARGERQAPNIIADTNSRLIKKLGTTEVEYVIRINKIMDAGNAINVMDQVGQRKGQLPEG